MDTQSFVQTHPSPAPSTAACDDGPDATDRLELDSCRPLDRIVVKTHNSVYDIIVLSGPAGTIVVRGGQLFPEFRCATFVGSLSGRGMEVRTICVGCRLELAINEKPYTTSHVEAMRRVD
jgi:hypothetical protein